MTLATGAKTRVGLETAREGSHLTVNCTIPETTRDVPAHARNWRLAEILGHADHPKETHLSISEEDQMWVEENLSKISSPVLTVSPGAQWITKRWPIEKYAEVTARAVQKYQLGVCLVGGPHESGIVSDAGVTDSEPRSLRCLSSIWLVKQHSNNSAAVLQRTDLMLTNDSGPMHLAAGLGTPVVGAFLCTDSARSGPAESHHELVSTTVECRASYKKQCPCAGEAHMACMRELDVERVWSALNRCVTKNQLWQSDAA